MVRHRRAWSSPTLRSGSASRGSRCRGTRETNGFIEADTHASTPKRLLASQANLQASAGDAVSGILLSLINLTDGQNDRPYLPEGEAALFASNLVRRELSVLAGHESVVNGATFSANMDRIITASSDGTARVWDAKTFKEVAVLRGHTGKVWSAVFSPNGKLIVTTSADRTARVWDAVTYQQIGMLSGHTGEVNGAAFSPDGRRVVTVCDDAKVRIFDAGTLSLITTLDKHTGPVNGITFTTDGKLMVTASSDRTARIWDAENYQQIEVFREHNAALESALLSPDGKRIITASSATTRIWDLATKEQITSLDGHHPEFNPKDGRLVTASATSVLTFAADTYSPIDVLRAVSV
jgi:WD40 repeat protein